jgi:peptide/nickel transport system permease protein
VKGVNALPAVAPSTASHRSLSAGGWFGLALVALVALLGALAPLAHFAPESIDLAASWKGPSAVHWFGTGDNGIDVLSQVAYGARISLGVALTAVLISGVLGTLLGTFVGYLGGFWDELAMRAVDVLLAFPGLLLAIFITAVLGPSVGGLILALCATSWVSYTRLARAQVLALREREFVLAARVLGASRLRIIGRHLLPNLLGPIIVQATLGLAGTILAEASLSFLGLGVPPGSPSWGALVDQGMEHLLDAPHVALIPGAAIAITVLGFNFFGDALQERLDPRGSVGGR